MILCQFCLQHTENDRKKKQSEVLLSTFVVAGHTWCISSSRARNFASSVCCRHRQTTFTSSTSFGHLSQPSPKYDSKPWHIKKHILNHDRLRYFQMDTKIWLRLGWIRNFWISLVENRHPNSVSWTSENLIVWLSFSCFKMVWELFMALTTKCD